MGFSAQLSKLCCGCEISARDRRDAFHVLISLILSPGVAVGINFLLDALGFEPSALIYFVTMGFLVTMAILILTECYLASSHPGTPKEAASPYVPASAIICAYMPNEAETIMETIDHFLQFDYEPGLQIILAYNTPKYLPIEADLRDVADKHPSLFLLNVQGSTSKAENLNAALDYVTGEFVGMFDADHCPDLDSYHRAWRWLSNGYEVVQGHCLSRNPEESFMAKMVAIEFETIYAVAHPGRYIKDSFGVFGGSNGYWITKTLKRIGMKGSMLTEDIDSSMRVIEEGGKIGSDPHLISRELSTTTARQFWNQRLRWSQGWTQVSIRHCWPMMTNKHFHFRQKFGSFMLLFIREIYPWVSNQIMTLMLYWWIKGVHINWIIPTFLVTTFVTIAVGPITVFVTYRLCHPSLKNKKWFFQYGVFSLFFFTEAKNTIARVGQIKEFFGESGWRVTARSANAKDIEIPASAEAHESTPGGDGATTAAAAGLAIGMCGSAGSSSLESSSGGDIESGSEISSNLSHNSADDMYLREFSDGSSIENEGTFVNRADADVTPPCPETDICPSLVGSDCGSIGSDEERVRLI